MYLKMAKRILFETDKRLLWKLAWNMGCKGMLSVQKHKRRAQTRRSLSAVPVRLDHQQLQPALPGLLGGRGRQAGDDQARRLAQADSRGQGDGQRLLRHRRRRAVHAPASARHARRSIPTATSRSSPTAISSPTRRPGGCAGSATSRRSSASRATRSSATSAAAGPAS